MVHNAGGDCWREAKRAMRLAACSFEVWALRADQQAASVAATYKAPRSWTCPQKEVCVTYALKDCVSSAWLQHFQVQARGCDQQVASLAAASGPCKDL